MKVIINTTEGKEVVFEERTIKADNKGKERLDREPDKCIIVVGTYEFDYSELYKAFNALFSQDTLGM